MKITSYLRTRERQEVGETDWAAELEGLLRRGVVDPDYLAGKVVIEAAGQGELVLADDLPPLVQNLCILGPMSLLEGRDFRFNYWGHEGEVRMRLEGGGVRIEGDFIASAVYPARELLAGLLACARRVLDMLKDVPRLRGAVPEGETPEHLEVLYREAEARLQQAQRRHWPG